MYVCVDNNISFGWTIDTELRTRKLTTRSRNIASVIVININSKTWKRSHCETTIRVAEVPQGRPREESEFRCVYCVPPSDKILKVDRKKRKRRAIGTVYAFFMYGTIPYTLLLCMYV